jgi:ribonuclease HII
MMRKYDQAFPEFGFLKNKGYGTKEHRSALNAQGYCPIHRKSFSGVKEHVKGSGNLTLL